MTTTTNEPTKSKLLEIIRKHYVKFSVISYLSAFLVFGLLISEQLCDKTYFSDNALLPGFVKRDFNFKIEINNNLRELRSLKLDRSSKSSESNLPIDWLNKKFKSLGLQVYNQQFKFNHPFSDGKNLTGTNFYAIFKSPRSLGTEALVLSSSFKLKSLHSKSTLPGISLMISLAEYFSTKNYWSKDLIFLIYEHDLIGCEAWLNAYYDLNDDNKNFIQFEQLEDHSGIIQAAINLEITSEQTPNLDVKIEGLNGQLTNLDLFNVVVEIASRESIDATYHDLSHLFLPDQFEIWIEYAKSIGAMMKSQASTFTNGAHGLFQKRSIQSLTLVAEEKPEDNDYLKADLNQIGKVIEGIFRSCNNMIERFNRSYWFYLLPSTRRYLSIGFYMIPVALIIIPSLLKAFVIYVNALENHKSLIETFWIVLPQVFWIHLYGIVMASFPFMIQNSSKLQSYFNFKTEELLFYSLLSFMSSLMFTPIINQELSTVDQQKSSKSSENLNKSRREQIISIQQYIALLELTLLITCLSLVNISLALGISSIYIPIMCTVSSNLKQSSNSIGRKAIRNLNRLFLIIANPLTILYLAELINSIYTKPNQSILIHLNDSFIAQKKFILSLVEDWYLFGNWTYLIGSLAIFPVWLQFYYLI